MKKDLLVVSLPPHISGEFRTRQIMRDVLIALGPACLAAFYYFGLPALLVVVTAVASCVLAEHLIQTVVLKRPTSVGDLSAIVTGVLLAFNVPSHLPLWMVALGGIFAVGIAKMCYGGLGMNPFNPALIGRVFLLVSFPAAMTSWPVPIVNRFAVDAVTAATPLGIVKEGIKMGEPVSQLVAKVPGLWDLFIGNR
ncbi:MAG: RnfABCDGE type electron transport complex subunit D, partial [Elusimicrobia bacterium]|nr:RnfABCDGE type electron transport complex subunit D [Elusimicrobiota bacterium]